MRRPGGIESIAELEVQRAARRGEVFSRLVGELKPHTATVVAALALIVVAAIAAACAPFLVGRAIDVDIAQRDRTGLLWRMAELFGVYAISLVAGRAQTRRVGATGQRVLASLRIRLFAHLQKLPLGYFDRRPIGDLMSRLSSDVDTLNQLFSQGLTQLLGAVLGLAGVLVAMLFLNVRLALASFTIIPVMLLVTGVFAARARAAYRKTRETTGDVSANLQEEIVGVRQAQAFNRTDRNIATFRGRNAANRDANVAAVGVTSAFSPTIDFLSTVSTALVIGYGGSLVLAGQLTVGTLAAFLIYTQQFFRPVQLAASVYALMQSALAGAERIYAMLDEPAEPADGASAKVLERLAGRIEFDGVSFGYSDAKQVLHEATFSIEAGQTVALVGKTGAGKTTIASLIPRLYDATKGVVRIDGEDVRQVSRASLRGQLAMVLQEPFLFSATIAQNIAYGKPTASPAEIEAAARLVSAHEFIAALPKGYDTVLGESGASVSQGQRQLLSFARAVVGEPRILILDEATANIDTRTEALIQAALAKVTSGRTSVIIAHRLSTVVKADLILVLEAGRIVERGTHAELLANGGVYAQLYSVQFREPVVTAARAGIA